MRKLITIFLIISLIMPICAPIMTVHAAATYTVVSIKSDGKTNDIGTYGNYADAKKAMLNYKSTIDDVAVIKKDNVIINAAYGIFRPDKSLSTINLSTDYGNGYISPPYNSDTLLLDYDENTNRVQIMISGVKGWTSLSVGEIYPISYITSGSVSYDANKKYVKILYKNGIRLREGPGTEYKQIGCNGANTCGASQGGIWTEGGAIYEWLNYGNVTSSNGNEWYQVNINGNIGYIANDPNTKDLEEFIPSTGLKQEFKTFYYVLDGELYHQYYVAVSSSTWTTRLGKAPLYLNANVRYYSFDGNYFYDNFITMVNDMKNNTYKNAVNKLPYYNYYQYLPVRTKTNYNADNLNAYIGYEAKIDRDKYYYYDTEKGKWEYKPEWTSPDWYIEDKNKSMLYHEGEAFIESQEKYGVNAAQTLALAINESGWGRSYMSVRQNNLFGHGAFDSAPDEYAAGYATVKDGIIAHAYKYIASDYANPINGYHYYGGHYGNKLSGNNVSYASDAYWGEKMVGNYYSLDKYFDFQDFRQRNTLGIKQTSEYGPVYSEPATTSIKYYNLKNVPNVPVTILEEVKGESINGNDIWYKIQSDLPIDENRTLQSDLSSYNFETSYAYIHSSYIYKESKEPIITASDVTIQNGAGFDPLKNVTAYDAFDGDVTSKIKVISNNVNVNNYGTYNVTYSVTDSEDNTAIKTITVTVLTGKPTITASDKTVTLNQTFDPLNGVVAYDKEDGDLTKEVKVTSNNVDIKKVGTYSITYSVTDKDNNTVTKTINVKVEAPKYKEIDNYYSFDSLSIVNNKLHFKGYISLLGVNNTLNNNIEYQLLFKNEMTGEEIYQNLNRITDTTKMPFMLEKEQGFDYTYSWFEGDINISNLPNGDYELYLIAHDNNNISKVAVTNVFGAPMVTTYVEDKKSVTFRNNFESRVPIIEVFVRDSLLGEKTANPIYNIYNEYSKIDFVNNKLVIKGTSHIIGGNYSKDTKVERKLTFENVNTFERFTFDIGSITTGDYKIELRQSDGFDKTKGWFETNIDLSSLPVGTYSINIFTKSNIADYGELQDIFDGKIDATMDYNGKNYTFSVNKNKRYRIELTVKNI